MPQPLPTADAPRKLDAGDDPAADSQHRPLTSPRRGACWYALMHQRPTRDADDHPSATRPRATHWSRTIAAVTS